MDVAGKPFAVHQIELLKSHGLQDLVFCIGHLGHLVREALGDGSRWGVRIRYVEDGDGPRGTGGALRRAVDRLGERFLVLYGDSYLECDYEGIIQAFLDGGCAGLMTVLRNDNQWDRSNIQFEDGRIVRYDKQSAAPEMHHIDYGLGALHHSALSGRTPEDAFDLVEVYQALVATGNLAGFEVTQRFYEIGSPRGLEETRAHLACRPSASVGPSASTSASS